VALGNPKKARKREEGIPPMYYWARFASIKTTSRLRCYRNPHKHRERNEI
jgi:hypothetical protein